MLLCLAGEVGASRGLLSVVERLLGASTSMDDERPDLDGHFDALDDDARPLDDVAAQ